MELWGRRFDTGEPVRLEIDQGRIARVTQAAGGSTPSATLKEDFQRWPWLAPGLLDLQVNGYGGHEFGSATLTLEHVVEIARVMVAFGVTRFCPTVTTEGFAVLRHALATIAAACEQSPDVAPRLPGIHLEGPFIASEDGPRGAHPEAHCRPPDCDEFQRLQDAAGGRIRIVTIAAEYPESAAFTERAARSGVVVSIGHTAATPAQIRAVVDAGARMSTHLGDGSPVMLHRFQNHLWPQLAEDRLTACLIADGHHLPPDVVKVFLRAKTPPRCILVSDLSGQAGQPPGRYSSPFCELEILPSGRLVVAGQRELLAGASLPLGTGIANAMRFAGVSLNDAVRMAVHHPAALLGIEPGGLEPGQAADLVQFDLAEPNEEEVSVGLKVRATLIAGAVVHGHPWRPELRQELNGA